MIKFSPHSSNWVDCSHLPLLGNIAEWIFNTFCWDTWIVKKMTQIEDKGFIQLLHIREHHKIRQRPEPKQNWTASMVAQMVKNLPAMRETQVWSLGGDQEGMATHFSILAWRIPWTEELGRLESMGSQRVGYDWSNLALTHTHLFSLSLSLSLSVSVIHTHTYIYKHQQPKYPSVGN